MVITVDKEALFKAISISDSVISSKNINTILANCLINVVKDEIEIISTDNDIAVRTKAKAVSDIPGSFTANGKKLAGILKELPNDMVNLDINESYLIGIKSGSSDVKGNYTLFGTSPDEFPEIPQLDFRQALEIDQAVMRDMIKKVIYAASLDTIKPLFNSVYFTSDGPGNLTFVASDSRRLSKITRSLGNKEEIQKGIIIPLKTINEIQRILGSQGKCLFSFEGNQCFFSINNTDIISRITDGQFPNYTQVIPRDFLFECLIEIKKLLNAVRRVIIFSKEPAHKISLTFDKNRLLIQASTPDLGEAEEEIPMESKGGEKITVGINAQFLIDTLKEMDSNSVKCGITGQMSPLSLSPEDDPTYVSVIMPLQIKTVQSD